MISTNNENKTIHIDNIEEYIINNNSNMIINRGDFIHVKMYN